MGRWWGAKTSTSSGGTQFGHEPNNSQDNCSEPGSPVGALKHRSFATWAASRTGMHPSLIPELPPDPGSPAGVHRAHLTLCMYLQPCREGPSAAADERCLGERRAHPLARMLGAAR